MTHLEPIIEAVKQATLLCREVQRHYLLSSTKVIGDKKEPVTIADYGSQAIICRAIMQHFPADGVIAEEQGSQFLELVGEEQRARVIQLLRQILDPSVTQDDVVRWLDHGKGSTAPRQWVIDPIDGTKGFVDMRHYAVAVGLLETGRPVEGVMSCPGYGDEGGALFFTHTGKAYQQPLAGGRIKPVTVSRRSEPSELVIVQSFEKAHAGKERMQTVRELAGMGHATVHELDSMEKYALVASGDADLYMRLANLDNVYNHRVWDHAAGVALVEAAGGVVSDVDGSPLDFSQGKTLPNKGMIVSNGLIHEVVVRAALELMRHEAK